MKQLIKYHQTIKETNQGTKEITEKRVDLEAELDTEDPNYNDQIKAIESYCGDNYTTEDVSESLEEIESKLRDIMLEEFCNPQSIPMENYGKPSGKERLVQKRNELKNKLKNN